jgi:hypothetical protein
MNARPTEITTLPIEMLYTIFEFLDAPTQKNFREVCKLFSLFKITKLVSIEHRPNVKPNFYLDSNLYSEIKYLSMRYTQPIKNVGHMSRLKRAIVSFSDVDINAETPMLSLIYLDISYNSSFDVENLKKFPNLRHLICQGVTTITDESVSHLKLTTLDAQYCKNIAYDIINGKKKIKPSPPPPHDYTYDWYC